MLSAFFHAAFYNPIYNALVALISFVPGGDIGVAVILLTIVIRLILLPFSLSAARTQRAIKLLDPKLKALKEEHKGDKEKEAIATLALYKEEKVNPFASILTVLVQLPVLLEIYMPNSLMISHGTTKIRGQIPQYPGHSGILDILPWSIVTPGPVP